MAVLILAGCVVSQSIRRARDHKTRSQTVVCERPQAGGRWDLPELHRMLDQLRQIGSFAAFERAMIRERTSAGIAVARAEGRSAAGKRSLMRRNAVKSRKA